MPIILVICFALIGQVPSKPPLTRPSATDNKPLEKSSYFAFVDREYIFTLEVVKPGVSILNFVCMGENERSLYAKEVRLSLETRKVPGKTFVIDTGDPKEPMVTPILKIRSRSSFGARLDCDFGDSMQLYGVNIKLGAEDFRLMPLSSFDFENLALKINKLNLGSPDFGDDWRVLKMELLGSRMPARK